MLPKELLIYINSFICKRKFDIEKDIIEVSNISPITETCNIIEYKGRRVCLQHDNKDLYHCFEVLSKITEKKNIIHFETAEICSHIKPYISNFGIFSHYCCDGKGIMFKIDSINNDMDSINNDMVMDDMVIDDMIMDI
jgi:hypothetical protein